MKARLVFLILPFCAPALMAQAPATQTHTSEVGFSYTLPADWEVVDTKPTLPQVQAEVARTAKSEDEKKGIGCVQVALTARHGDPGSVIVVVALPYACYGSTMTEKDLPGFGAGVAEGIKNTFNISNPVQADYVVGTHSFWIQRAAGVLKDHPEEKYTVETVCSVLKLGSVCWMAMAADDAALRIFEQGAAGLDGEAPSALVPATAFQKKP